MNKLADVLRIPKERVTLKRQAIDRLRIAILGLHLSPGERLVERTLGDAMGVSRTAVREALCHLEAEGLVEAGVRGPHVAHVTREDAAEVYEAREVLEASACRWFAERASDEQVTLLEEAAQSLDLAFRSADMHAILVSTRVFYQVLLEGCGNTIVAGFLQGLQGKAARLRAMSMASRARHAQSMEEIDAIVDALKRRDADAAADAAVVHVRNARAAAMEFFNEHLPGAAKPPRPKSKPRLVQSPSKGRGTS